jgi:activator of HSP90 ATPase
MMLFMESFKLVELFPVAPDILYNAWLDSVTHAEFIRASAEIDPRINGKFTIWDNYISGTTIELTPNKKIVQQWRTTEFPKDSPDSILELTFEPIKEGTKLTLLHKNIPYGQGDEYKSGWKENYFAPMQEFFT